LRPCPFLKGHISKKIPPDIAAFQYLGFTPPATLKSPMNLLNPEYWDASRKPYRYGLEKMGMVE
jgi:hypothetical protein